MSGNSAYEGEMYEVALFESALRVAVPTQPDPRLGRDLVPRLAQAARAATIEAETQAGRRGVTTAGRRRTRTRLALVARVATAVALIPLVLAGLAFAGVTVPAPARDAFDSVGITLPNQPAEGTEKATQSQPQDTGNDVSDAAKSGAHRGKGGNSAAAHQHAREQRAKARGKALGRERGKAIGLNDLAPPSQSGDTGPPEHSNAGGSAKSQSVRPAPKPRPRPNPFPPGNARGQSQHP